MPGENNSLIMNNKNILQAVFCALKRDGSIQKMRNFVPIHSAPPEHPHIREQKPKAAKIHKADD